MARRLRVCVIYDCLYPWTVGGHERWLRQLAETLAAAGHDVTFLTRRQWDVDEPPDVPGVRVIAVSKLEPLYGPDGARRNGEAVRFGIGVGRHLLRNRHRYDVVHTCGFPYFHLPALRLALLGTGIPVFVDWPEVWSAAYWWRYSGRIGGSIGIAVQALCVRLTPRAVAYSRTHGDRLARWGLRRPALRPGGLAGEPVDALPSLELSGPPVVVFAGRHIREKRAPLVVSAAAIARASLPGLRAVVMGDGPERDSVLATVASLEASSWCEVPGFVSTAQLTSAIRTASVLVHPTEREGFGLVVLEAAMAGTPVVLVPGRDNAAAELVVPGVNGELAASASAADVAAAIVRVVDAGAPLRVRASEWYAENADSLDAARTVTVLEGLYVAAAVAAAPSRRLVGVRRSPDSSPPANGR